MTIQISNTLGMQEPKDRERVSSISLNPARERSDSIAEDAQNNTARTSGDIAVDPEQALDRLNIDHIR